MRIRLTFEITRSTKPDATPEPPYIDEKPATLIEHGGAPRYIGFTPEHEIDPEERRR